MSSDVRSIFDDFAGRLSGRRVSIAGLFLNSLRICVDRQLREKAGFFLWFEPVWQLGSPHGILVGSRQAQVEDREARAALDLLVQRLVGRQIERVSLELLTNDIDVRFSGGYWVRTFVSDPAADENWYLRDCISDEVVSGAARGLEVRDEALSDEGGEPRG